MNVMTKPASGAAMIVEFDKETNDWFKQHPLSETTVICCPDCGLFYKPSLGHKCKEANKNGKCKRCNNPSGRSAKR